MVEEWGIAFPQLQLTPKAVNGDMSYGSTTIELCVEDGVP